MANEQTDSGTVYNDLLERVNQMSNEMTRLADRIKVLEDRAIREEAKAEAVSWGKKLGQMFQDGK
jgi:hypothetical protein